MGASASKVKAKPGIVVTLDALGTIYKFKEPIALQYIKVAQRCGLKAKIKPGDLKKAFGKSFEAISARYPNYGKDQLPSVRAWWKMVTDDAFRQVVEEPQIPSYLSEELFDHFKSSAAYELYPDVKPFLASMRQIRASSGDSPHDPPIMVGVITNSDPRVKSILESLSLRVGLVEMASIRTDGLRIRGREVPDITMTRQHGIYQPFKDIDFLTTSYTVGSEKPAKHIFARAQGEAALALAARIGRFEGDHGLTWQTLKKQMANTWQASTTIAGSSFIHIGDDYAKDYMGAKAALGFEALHLVRDGQGPAVAGAQTVRSLDEAAASIRLLVEMNLRKDQD